MANDRLYIVCQCGEWNLLYKFYPMAGYIKDGAEDWLNKHVLECGKKGPALMSVVWENQISAMTTRPNTGERYPKEGKG